MEHFYSLWKHLFRFHMLLLTTLLLLPSLVTHAQGGAESGLPWASGGWVDRGAGYDMLSGLPKRTVVDFEVPGAVGAYPLRLARTMTVMSRPQNGPEVYGYTYWNFDHYYRMYVGGEVPAVIYPNGTLVVFDLIGGGAKGVGDRVERVEGKKRGEFQFVLRLGDGGHVEFEPLSATDSSRGLVGTKIVDPHGLPTTVVPHNEDGPARVEDASGRWLEFVWEERDGSSAIQSARSSAGQSVRFSTMPGWGKFYPELIDRVAYADGSEARYEYTSGRVGCFPFLPKKLSDVRSTSAMPTVEYRWVVDDDAICVVGGEYATDGAAVSIRTSARAVPFRYRHEVLPHGEQRLYEFVEGLLVRKSEFSRDPSFEDPHWTFDYDAHSYLRYVKDPLGREWTLVNELVTGKPLTITYPDSFTKAYTYTEPAAPYFLRTVTDERHQTTTYHRYPDGRVQAIEYPDHTSETWEDLDRFGNARKRVLRNGSHQYRSYDDMGRLKIRWEPMEVDRVPKDPRAPLPPEVGFTTYTYYPDGDPWEDLLESEIDPLGHKTSYEYACWAGIPCFSTVTSVLPTRPGDIAPGTPVSGRPLPTRITYADGTSKRFTYDAHGNKTSETDEEGHTQTWSYDEFNRIKSHMDANQKGATTYDYRPLIAIASTLKPLDVSIDWDPDPAITALSHTSRGPSVVTSPDKRTKHSVFDTYARLSYSAEALGKKEDVAIRHFRYDPGGRLDTQYDPRGRITKFTYDARDRRKTMEDPEHRVTTWNYDPAGNVEAIIYPKPSEQTVSFTYDEVNRVKTRTDERGQVTTNVYRGGQLEDVIDHEGRESGFRYDASGRITKRLVPDETRKAVVHEAVVYDQKGNLKIKRTARGTQIDYDYDERDRETKRTYSDGRTPTRSVERYDLVGRPKTITDGMSRYEFDYDAGGQVVHVRQRYGNGRLRAITYRYDRDGHRIGMDAPFHHLTVNRLFTWRGQPFLFFDEHGMLASYDFFPDGSRKSARFANGQSTTYHYDESGRLQSVDGPGITDRVYGYDERHRVKTVESLFAESIDYFPDSQVKSYGRTARMPQECGARASPAAQDAFTYDGSGNRLTSNAHGVYTVGGSNRYNAVSGADADTFGYDAAGNLEVRDGWKYTYDAESRLASATRSDGAQWRFFYDVLGNLVAIQDDLGALKYAVYDGTHPIAWFRWHETEEALLEATVWGVHGDEPIVTNRLGERSIFYHLDPQNNVVQTSDWSGQPVQAFYYGAFGEPTPLALTGVSWCAADKDAPLPSHLFTGQPWLAELGLYHFRARAYDPQLGRFLQKDPLGITADETNLYRYSRNDPRNMVDPDGKDPSLVWDAMNVALDVADIATDVAAGHYVSAAIGVAALTADAAAGAVPFLPAVAGPARRAFRAGEAIQDGAKAAKGVEAAADGLRQGERASEAAGEAATAASKVAGEAADAAGALCFAAGTLVHTGDGLRPIEEVEEGDFVWSRDESKSAVGLRRVTRTVKTLEQSVLELGIEGENGSDVLLVTEEHPFWTQRGWAEARSLLPTDTLLLRSSAWAHIKSAQAVDHPTTVHNLEVEEFHTYFVGAQGAWVHNTCARGDGAKVNWGQQEKHFPGHNSHTPGRSAMTADPEKLAGKAGTGEQVGKAPVGEPGSKERVDFGETIGQHVDPATGTAVDTTKGIIHYGKDGVHIVPARP